MSQQVVTELVIDSNTSGAAEYERAMDGAAAAAGRGASANSGFGLTIAAVGAGALAAVAGVKSFLDYVAQANKGLADMQQNAKTAGLSLADFQVRKFGANVNGLTDDQFNSGLQKSAALLNDAQRNANSLSKLFEENGDKIKNNNGQLITENQLLEKAGGYIKNAATEQDKIKIAEMLGYTKQWVPFLEQSAGAFGEMASEAKAAGAVIDNDTIQKAADFDREWRKASVEWEANLKSAAAAVLPVIDDLITRAGKIFTKENVQKAADAGLNAVADAGVPDSAKLVINITDEGRQAMKDFREASSTLEAVVGLIPKLTSIVSFAGSSVNPLRYSGGSSEQETEYPPLGPYTGDVRAKKPADPTAIPANSVAKDAVDRAIESLQRHTERQEADTRAAGLGAGALARFRAEAAETAAVLANGGEETAKQAADFAVLKDRAEAAAIALEKAKIANTIQFNRITAFLSPEDVQIAQQLKGIYGNDIPAALASSEAAAIRFNNVLREANTFGRDLASSSAIGFAQQYRDGQRGILEAEKKINDARADGNAMTATQIASLRREAREAANVWTILGNVATRALDQIENKLLDMATKKLWDSAFGGASGGNFLSGMFGSSAGVSGAQSVSLTGLSTTGTGGLYHSGGIVGHEPTSMRAVNDNVFVGAQRFHGGLMPDEFPAILQRGEGVFTRGQMAAMGSKAGGGTSVNVTVINQTGVQAKTETQQGPNGDVTIVLKKMVDDAVGESLSTGTGKRVLNKQYGIKQFAGQ